MSSLLALRGWNIRGTHKKWSPATETSVYCLSPKKLASILSKQVIALSRRDSFSFLFLFLETTANTKVYSAGSLMHQWVFYTGFIYEVVPVFTLLYSTTTYLWRRSPSRYFFSPLVSRLALATSVENTMHVVCVCSVACCNKLQQETDYPPEPARGFGWLRLFNPCLLLYVRWGWRISASKPKYKPRTERIEWLDMANLPPPPHYPYQSLVRPNDFKRKTVAEKNLGFKGFPPCGCFICSDFILKANG